MAEPLALVQRKPAGGSALSAGSPHRPQRRRGVMLWAAMLPVPATTTRPESRQQVEVDDVVVGGQQPRLARHDAHVDREGADRRAGQDPVATPAPTPAQRRDSVASSAAGA